MITDQWTVDIQSGRRFAFGENWARYIAALSEKRIQQATESLKKMLEGRKLDGLTFLDVGSGSGLFSLAARRLGARVTSFDYDPGSVACTTELKRRYYADDPCWSVLSGSVLDRPFLGSLGKFDVVYSWGVLHHTGAMWSALDNIAPLVSDEGRLFVALYNDQGSATQRWRLVKRAYCAAPHWLKWAVLAPAFLRLWGPTVLRDTLRGDPLRSWKAYSRNDPRGMDPWRDVVDWVGGLPFEVARPEQVLAFYRERGFELLRMTTCGGGLGCNQFVLQRKPREAC